MPPVNHVINYKHLHATICRAIRAHATKKVPRLQAWQEHISEAIGLKLIELASLLAAVNTYKKSNTASSVELDSKLLNHTIQPWHYQLDLRLT
jgi:hypothetical protein